MFFNKKYIKVNHNEEPEKTQAEEPKQEEAKETAPVVETVTCKIWSKWENRTEQRIMGGNNRKNKAGARKTRIRKRRAREKFQNSNAIFCYKSR